MQIAYYNCMVVVEVFDKERKHQSVHIMMIIHLGKSLKHIGSLHGS
jgi:hypothetical protein